MTRYRPTTSEIKPSGATGVNTEDGVTKKKLLVTSHTGIKTDVEQLFNACRPGLFPHPLSCSFESGLRGSLQ